MPTPSTAPPLTAPPSTAPPSTAPPSTAPLFTTVYHTTREESIPLSITNGLVDKPARTNTPAPRAPIPSIHCHVCEEAIQGNRYQCQMCGDVNLCRDCREFHPSTHVLEILSCLPSDSPPPADSPLLPAESNQRSRAGSDSDQGSGPDNDDEGDEDYQYSDHEDEDHEDEDHEDEDQNSDTGTQNTSLDVTKRSTHLGLWSSSVTAQRPSSEVGQSQVTISLSDEQFAIWLRETKRIMTQSITTLHVSNRRQQANRDNGIVVHQRRSTPHRRWGQEDQERLRALKGDGTPDKEIAVLLDRSASSIRQQWRRQHKGGNSNTV
ncbi:hypothetical protein F5Y12DRAFT_720852 [Xylaria sp. FL1777]|nr:hypothetical protein F5Y12DRAFT_720852 [Xylaria sp. FL1777]